MERSQRLRGLPGRNGRSCRVLIGQDVHGPLHPILPLKREDYLLKKLTMRVPSFRFAVCFFVLVVSVHVP